MKKTVTFLLIIFISATSIFAQEDSDWQEKTYNVGDFSRISVEGGFRIHLIQGEETKVLVKTPDSDVFDKLQIKDWGNELKIYWEPNNFSIDRIALYITFKNLHNLHIEGGVKLYTHGYLDLKDIDIYLSGGAKVNMDLKADNIHIVGEGGVLFNLDGIANSLDISLSGAGHVNAEDLKVKDASIEIEGVGTSSVYATENLNVEIEGVGKVVYSGTPRITREIEGFGSVKRKD